MKIFILSILLFLGLPMFSVIAQNKYNITYTRDSFNSITAIHFQAIGKSIPAKTLDIVKENPFNYLPYAKQEARDRMGNSKYYVKNRFLGEFLTANDLSHYREDFKINAKTPVGSLASSAAVWISETGKYHVIAYELILNEGLAGAVTSFIVIDTLGNEVNQLMNIGINANEVVITNDDRYLGFGFGWRDSEEGNVVKDGFRIYDLQKKEKIIEVEEANMGAPFVKHNLMIFGYTSYPNSERRKNNIIYNFDKNKKYSRIFTPLEEGQVIDISTEGYVLKRPGNDIKTLYFTKDFKVEDIK